MASTMATRLRAIEKARLRRMVVIIRRDRASRWGSSSTRSFTRTMSAASTAISLPTPPMAMPTKALFRAGASLMPSPTMQIRTPACWARSIQLSLSSGRQPARYSRMDSVRAMWAAAFSLSPVRSTGDTPSALRARSMAAASPRTVSARAQKPAGAPSTAR